MMIEDVCIAFIQFFASLIWCVWWLLSAVLQLKSYQAKYLYRPSLGCVVFVSDVLNAYKCCVSSRPAGHLSWYTFGLSITSVRKIKHVYYLIHVIFVVKLNCYYNIIVIITIILDPLE